MLGLGFTKYIPFGIYIFSIIILAFTLFHKTEIGIYFLISLLPIQNLLDKLHIYPLGNDLVDIFIIAFIFCWVFKRKQNEIFWQKAHENKAILFYLILTYAYLWIGSFSFEIDLPISIYDLRFTNWKNHAILPILFFIILNNITERRQIIILLGCIVFSMLLVCLGFKANLGSVASHFQHDRRSLGVFSYLGPNEIGAFFATYSMIILALLLESRQIIVRLGLALVFAFNMWSLLFTWSRGAYVAAFVGCVYLAFLRNRIILLLLFALPICWQTVLPLSVIERVEMTRSEEGNLEGSGFGRIQMWNHGLQLFKKNPFGYGLDTIQFLGFHKHGHWDTEFKIKKDPHNKYIEYLVEMGVLGLFIFLYLYYLAFLSGWRLYRTANDIFFKGLGVGFSACVLSSMVVNIFGDRWTYVPLAAFYWVFWALVVRATLLTQSTSTTPSEVGSESKEQQSILLFTN